jgi:hypothetical protein
MSGGGYHGRAGVSRRAGDHFSAASASAAAGAGARAAARRGACPTCPTPPPRRPLSRRASRSCARVLRDCSRALLRAHLCSRARSFSILLVLRASKPRVGPFDAPVQLVVPPAVVGDGMRAAPAHAASTHGQVLQLLMKPLLLHAKDLALERTLGAPSTAVDVVVGEPQLLGAAVFSAPDVGGCCCGGGSGGSGGGGGLTGNLLLCLRC